jgi:hypothetical protein
MAVRERETRERDTRAAIAPTNAPATAPWPTLAANARWRLLLSPYRRPSSARAAARLRGPRPNATAAESVMVRRFRRATRVRGPQARQRAMPGFRTAACSAAARASGNVQVGMCKWECASGNMPGFRTAACSAAACASGNVQVGMCKWECASGNMPGFRTAACSAAARPATLARPKSARAPTSRGLYYAPRLTLEPTPAGQPAEAPLSLFASVPSIALAHCAVLTTHRHRARACWCARVLECVRDGVVRACWCRVCVHVGAMRACVRAYMLVPCVRACVLVSCVRSGGSPAQRKGATTV